MVVGGIALLLTLQFNISLFYFPPKTFPPNKKSRNKLHLSTMKFADTAFIFLFVLLGVSNAVNQDICSSVEHCDQPFSVEDERDPDVALAMDPTVPITFSEYPQGTSITDQYASTKGVIFGGDDPFITTDSANPTSPVLSGTPRFNGDIRGSFVDPDDPTTPTAVRMVEFDAGYFDEVGSTRVKWFGPDGAVLGQKINVGNGIQKLTLTGGNIASFHIGIFKTEPAGYAIDNFVSFPAESGVVFREKSGDGKDGTWGFLDDEIPGFDHVGLNYKGDVYECHPGYSGGTYRNADNSETVTVSSVNGVQQEFTKDTFKHNSKTAATKVVDFQEIGLSAEDAEKMKDKIETKMGSATFQFINFDDLDGIQETLSPAAQKGGDNSFTCVGLIEWAAEEAGINGGEGLVPNSMESIDLPGDISLPLLSPQVMYLVMKGESILDDAKDLLKGFFDPVDYLLTDPLGRRVGYVDGVSYDEIPLATRTPDGNVEYLLIPNPLPGVYQLKVYGVGEPGIAAVEFVGGGVLSIETDRGTGLKIQQVELKVSEGSKGDVNGNGSVDMEDVTALQALIPVFTDGLTHPGDMNADGVLNNTDVDMLTEFVNLPEPIIGICDEELKCDGLFGSGFRMTRSRFLGRRCVDRCVSGGLMTRFRLRLGWECGSCL